MLSNQLKAEIDAIPGEKGWWKGEPAATYHVAEKLLENGITDEEIVDILSAVYSDVAREFGC